MNKKTLMNMAGVRLFVAVLLVVLTISAIVGPGLSFFGHNKVSAAVSCMEGQTKKKVRVGAAGAQKTVCVDPTCPSGQEVKHVKVGAAQIPKAVCVDKTASSGGGSCDKTTFFGLAPWYQYLPMHKDSVTHRCEIDQNQVNNVLGKGSFILLIVLAIVDDLLRIAGLIAVVFMIIAGFKLMTAQGNPEALASARKTMMFALVGLVVAIIAVVIVSFIGNSIGK